MSEDSRDTHPTPEAERSAAELLRCGRGCGDGFLSRVLMRLHQDYRPSRPLRKIVEPSHKPVTLTVRVPAQMDSFK